MLRAAALTLAAHTRQKPEDLESFENLYPRRMFVAVGDAVVVGVEMGCTFVLAVVAGMVRVVGGIAERVVGGAVARDVVVGVAGEIVGMATRVGSFVFGHSLAIGIAITFVCRARNVVREQQKRMWSAGAWEFLA